MTYVIAALKSEPTTSDSALGDVTLLLNPNPFFADNGLNMEGQLPLMKASIDDPSTGLAQPSQVPVVSFSYPIPAASSFDWVGGPTPLTLSGQRAGWTESSSATAQDIPIAAIDRAAETADSNRTFVAGLLFGIAGGAGIAGLQELLHVHPRVRGSGRSTAAAPGRLTSSGLALSLLLDGADSGGVKEALRWSDGRGYAAGAFSLGLLLEDEGDLGGAKEAFRRADQRGHAAGAFSLGLLLAGEGDAEGARAAFRRAHERGYTAGANDSERPSKDIVPGRQG